MVVWIVITDDLCHVDDRNIPREYGREVGSEMW